MYVGSSASLPMNISYNSSVVGILGESPDSAVFVDGTGGAVMRMTISAVRPNIFTRIATSEDPNTCSNKAFIEKLIKMRSSIQMMDNAFVLRIYNLSTLNMKDYSRSISYIEAKRSGPPKEIPVFIESFDISLDMSQPNQISVTLNLILRNKLKGYNE